MCGACPGGTLVSTTTAELNRTGRKRQAAAELRRGLAPGCTLTLVGDGWSLRRRTGRQEVFDDVEHLVAALEGHAAADWTGPDQPRAVVARVLEPVLTGPCAPASSSRIGGESDAQMSSS